MKKFGLVLFALIVLGIAIFIVMVSSPGDRGQSNVSGLPSDAIDEYGISDKQKANALKAALAEPTIVGEKYEVDGICMVKPSDVGFLNVSGLLIRVRLHYMLAGLERIQFDVVIDPVSNKTMAVSYEGVPPGPYDWGLVSPGASWYHKTRTGNIRSGNSYTPGTVVREVHTFIESRPSNSIVYLTIVDENNFKKLVNGSPYEAAVFIDPTTGYNVSLNCMPIKGRWNATLTLPAVMEEYEYGTRIITEVSVLTFYLVLKNGDAYNDVKMTYAMPGFM